MVQNVSAHVEVATADPPPATRVKDPVVRGVVSSDRGFVGAEAYPSRVGLVAGVWRFLLADSARWAAAGPLKNEPTNDSVGQNSSAAGGL